MNLMPEVASRLFNTPLMVHPGKAAAAIEGLGYRLFGSDVEVAGADPVHHVAFGREHAGRIGDRLGRRYDAERLTPFDVYGKAAIIPIEGTLVHKGSYVGASSGKTSYQGLQAQIVRAARDPAIAGVAFEVDSFGGEVAGAFETADMIAELSKVKPTIAILTDFALSAGYLMASAARQIVMPEHGRAGSIGIITMHADYSGALAQKGVRVTVIHAGKRKADGSPYAALPAEVEGRIKDSVERKRAAFANAVGKYRGSRFNSAQALATEAEDFDGTDAVNIGMADAIGDANSSFDQFIRAIGR